MWPCRSAAAGSKPFAPGMTFAHECCDLVFAVMLE